MGLIDQKDDEINEIKNEYENKINELNNIIKNEKENEKIIENKYMELVNNYNKLLCDYKFVYKNLLYYQSMENRFHSLKK